MNSIEELIKKGVNIPNPESVDIGEDIDVDRIAARDVTIFSGCKLYGPETFIAEGAQIGFEAPVTIQDCYVGPSVALKGGFFQEAVFLKKSSCGLGSHVRKGTILEEEAGIAHTVGLKQTILFPFVTLGSLINFCDCLMAGGTSRKNHSEVGSSYIHFNYTPNQDKATPSLIGDVANGVMLNQSPIFLGGQGGLVGPCRIAYGTVVAAGSICRKDQLKGNYLVIENGHGSARISLKPGGYSNLERVLNHNFNYIGNLLALWQWYDGIRSLFVGPDFPQEISDGLKKTLKFGIDERIKQMGRLRDIVQNTLAADALPKVAQIFCDRWDNIHSALADANKYQGSPKLMDQFSIMIENQIKTKSKKYIPCIQSLAPDQIEKGTQWLQSIVDQVIDQVTVTLEMEIIK
jgi:UDP-N-acetylglucosamine/UDP-N-acetylgalactosamine diphosphorylase